MHAAIFEAFDAICRQHTVRGAVLEIGATPDDSSLLNLPALSGVSENYYRFSEQAFHEGFFAGMEDVVIRTLLVPPRIIGAGIRR